MHITDCDLKTRLSVWQLHQPLRAAVMLSIDSEGQKLKANIDPLTGDQVTLLTESLFCLFGPWSQTTGPAWFLCGLYALHQSDDSSDGCKNSRAWWTEPDAWRRNQSGSIVCLFKCCLFVIQQTQTQRFPPCPPAPRPALPAASWVTIVYLWHLHGKHRPLKSLRLDKEPYCLSW